jgi:hypothetical protein
MESIHGLSQKFATMKFTEKEDFITIEILERAVELLRKEQRKGFNIQDFFQFVQKENVKQSPQVEKKIEEAEKENTVNFQSTTPTFTFSTPKQPFFTPFTVDGQPTFPFSDGPFNSSKEILSPNAFDKEADNPFAQIKKSISTTVPKSTDELDPEVRQVNSNQTEEEHNPTAWFWGNNGGNMFTETLANNNNNNNNNDNDNNNNNDKNSNLPNLKHQKTSIDPNSPLTENMSNTTKTNPFDFSKWHEEIKFEVGQEDPKVKSEIKRGRNKNKGKEKTILKKDESIVLDPPEFTVYSLGATDILHSLNEDGTASSQQSSSLNHANSTSETAPLHTAHIPIFAGLDGDDDMSVDEMMEIRSPAVQDTSLSFDFTEPPPIHAAAFTPVKQTTTSSSSSFGNVTESEGNDTMTGVNSTSSASTINLGTAGPAANTSNQAPGSTATASSTSFSMPFPEVLSSQFAGMKLDGAGVTFNIGADDHPTHPSSAQRGKRNKKKEPTKAKAGYKANFSNLSKEEKAETSKDENMDIANNTDNTDNQYMDNPLNNNNMTGETKQSLSDTGMNQVEVDPAEIFPKQNADHFRSPRRRTNNPSETYHHEPNNKTEYFSTAAEQQSKSSADASLSSLAELYSKQGKELYSIGMYER